ncbi:MAG: succinate dehydrogenase/fumarate reductase iron-sulfur subunit, partial [Hyphomicrobiales bacterium]|nr:succinate dehydrogenase/fumarate reductase iron-sulfur subunit [Hyphomicrobiales bacterium]
MSMESLSVSVRRGKGERYDEFTVERRENQTVLDVVTEIQRAQDASLSYRFACRVG